MATTEVKVPDIGNYTNIPVIEVLVKPGDTVARDQGLVTLESDKATMEVPSPVAGVVKEVKVKVGDEISEGRVVAIVETNAAATSSAPSPPVGEGRGEGKSATQAAIPGASSDRRPASPSAAGAASTSPHPPPRQGGGGQSTTTPSYRQLRPQA